MSTDTAPREADHPARAAFEAWHAARTDLLFSRRQAGALDRDEAGAYRHAGVDADWRAFRAGHDVGCVYGAAEAREADAADARMRASERAR